ncbi:MAG TPA: aldolase/citrate lyase family protein [Roseiarcus sp.]|jgi:4-hydroxy-2-oxoheptanedioate aldolase|nr:aldolase/citrate lyase family protein [Roseiarcus sp.]
MFESGTGVHMNEAVVGKLSQALGSEAPVFCGWAGWNEPAVAEALAREPFDAVALDMQHGAFDFAGASRAILAMALAGKPAIVRVPVGEFALASRLLDAGAAGIIAPMINSRDDARRLVAFTKFLPLGERSWGPRAVLPLSGLEPPAYLAAANAMTQTIAMIETRAALEALDDILGVEGVDGVFIGPSDLSIALSGGRAPEPRGAALMEAAGHIVARARAHRKYAAMFCFDGADAAAMAALGLTLCSIASDQTLLRGAARAELEAARAGAAPRSRKGDK